MREATALEVAVGLLQLPSRVPTLRDGDLPPDIETLLRIVADDDGALPQAMAATKQTAITLQTAASFFVEQILLHPGADSYRALGARPDATMDQLRRNMALLLRWLHPDRDANRARALFAGRVTEAWNNLKTLERRAQYDAARRKGIYGDAKKDPVGAGASSMTSSRAGTHAAPSARHGSSTGGRDVRRKRPRPASVWRFLKHLMGHGRT